MCLLANEVFGGCQTYRMPHLRVDNGRQQARRKESFQMKQSVARYSQRAARRKHRAQLRRAERQTALSQSLLHPDAPGLPDQYTPHLRFSCESIPLCENPTCNATSTDMSSKSLSPCCEVQTSAGNDDVLGIMQTLSRTPRAQARWKESRSCFDIGDRPARTPRTRDLSA